MPTKTLDYPYFVTTLFEDQCFGSSNFPTVALQNKKIFLALGLKFFKALILSNFFNL